MQQMTVFLENQHVKTHVGWEKAERDAGVDLWISVFAWFDLLVAPKVGEDEGEVPENLAHTIDYTTILRIILEESTEELRLLETLADNIGRSMLRVGHENINRVVVEIRKKKLDVQGYDADAAGVKWEWRH